MKAQSVKYTTKIQDEKQPIVRRALRTLENLKLEHLKHFIMFLIIAITENSDMSNNKCLNV